MNLNGKGMSYSFVDKNKSVKRNIAIEMEALAVSLDKSVDTQSKEEFHEFLRGHTNKFAPNVYLSQDNTVKSLKPINNKNMVVLFVIMDNTHK